MTINLPEGFEARAKELIGTPYSSVRFILWTENFGTYQEIEVYLAVVAQKWGEQL